MKLNWKAFGLGTLAAVATVGAGVAAYAGFMVPSNGPYGYFESDRQGLYKYLVGNQPFLGNGVEPLGEFEIHKVSFKQSTGMIVEEQKVSKLDLCTSTSTALTEIDRKVVESSCGIRIWAYRAGDQIFLFRADRDEISRSETLTVHPFVSTSWDGSITVQKARENLLNSKVMRGFSIPDSALEKNPKLKRTSATRKLYGFSGSVRPGEVLHTAGQALGMNAVLIVGGVTVNPMYVVEHAKDQPILSEIKVIETASVSLFFASSTFTTEYFLRKVTASH
jgi:hypothetical protein